MSEPIQILLAVYRPDMDFFRAQLDSLDAQDAPGLSLLMLDDSADAAWHERIQEAAARHLRRLPYSLSANPENLGSLGTFARLTETSTAPLLAYCDQDDIWLPNKVSALAALLGENPEAQLAYCNQSIIDGQGVEQYATLQDMRRRFRHLSGEGLYPYFLHNNCVTGACMMVRGPFAREALPFPASYVHDQWLALNASVVGPILYDPAPLVRYRLHDHNVVGMASLSGITDRDGYVQNRLLPYVRMLRDAARIESPLLREEIGKQQAALETRIRFLSGHPFAALPALVRQGVRDPVRLCFELALGLLPRGLGRRIILFAQRH